MTKSSKLDSCPVDILTLPAQGWIMEAFHNVPKINATSTESQFEKLEFSLNLTFHMA